MNEKHVYEVPRLPFNKLKTHLCNNTRQYKGSVKEYIRRCGWPTFHPFIVLLNMNETLMNLIFNSAYMKQRKYDVMHTSSNIRLFIAYLKS